MWCDVVAVRIKVIVEGHSNLFCNVTVRTLYLYVYQIWTVWVWVWVCVCLWRVWVCACVWTVWTCVCVWMVWVCVCFLRVWVCICVFLNGMRLALGGYTDPKWASGECASGVWLVGANHTRMLKSASGDCTSAVWLMGVNHAQIRWNFAQKDCKWHWVPISKSRGLGLYADAKLHFRGLCLCSRARGSRPCLNIVELSSRAQGSQLAWIWCPN